MGSLLIDNFAGGLNLRDAPNQLTAGETPSALNFMLTERGGLKRRPGCANIGTLPGLTTTNAYIFWSEALAVFVCARSSGGALHVFTSTSGATGTWTDRGTINSVASAKPAFVDFPRSGTGAAGPVVVITSDINTGGTKGTFILDSTFALTNVSTTVSGSALALWQDRAIIVGYPVSDTNGNPTSIFACKPKDPTDWTTGGGGWTNQIRERDATALTGLGVVGGALIVFKQRSSYRVNDSGTGAYTTIDPAVGCVNPRAVAQLYGHLYVWAMEGIHECDGIGGLRNVGDKVRPITFGAALGSSEICASVFEDSVVFTGGSGVFALGSTQVDVLQYYPRLGAIVAHTLANTGQNQVTSMSRSDGGAAGKSVGTVFAAVADGDALFSVFSETSTGMGKDDATGYTASWLTPWLLPNSGMLARLQRGRVQGAAGTTVTVNLDVYRDWLLSSPNTFDVSASLRPGSAVQAAADIMSLGHSAAFAFQFRTDNANGVNTALSIRALQLVDTPLQYPNPGYPRTIRPGSPPQPVPVGRGGGGAPPPLPPPNP